MKLFSTLVIMFMSVIALHGQEAKGFELYFSTYDHSNWLVDNYKITDREIVVSVKALFEEKDSVVYTKKIRPSLVEKIKSLKLDTLEKRYYNNCIMIVSGAEYFIGLYDEGISRQIHLHHYYQKDIAHLVELINLSVPEEYHIDYVGEDTEQDCP